MSRPFATANSFAFAWPRPTRHGEGTDPNVIPARIAGRELLCSSVRIDAWLLFELSDDRAYSLKSPVEIIDPAGGRSRVSSDRGSSMRDACGCPTCVRRAGANSLQVDGNQLSLCRFPQLAELPDCPMSTGGPG